MTEAWNFINSIRSKVSELRFRIYQQNNVGMLTEQRYNFKDIKTE